MTRHAIVTRLLMASLLSIGAGCANWQPDRMAFNPATTAPASVNVAAVTPAFTNTPARSQPAYLAKPAVPKPKQPVTMVAARTSRIQPVQYTTTTPATSPNRPAVVRAQNGEYIQPGTPNETFDPNYAGSGLPDGTVGPFGQPYVDIDPTMSTPVDVIVNETQTGRFMFGAGVNSEAGVTGQIVIDERNFDLFRVPHSFDDVVNGTAFRGAGQGFRLEAMPGSQVQRYLASFTEPYLFNSQISFNVSGFLYDRRFTDWDEQRLGGRMAFGYRLTHDLSFSAALRGERVDISNPRVGNVPELNAAIGRNNIYSGKFSLTHDTRDIPFSPTEGHLIELSYEQVFGDYDYPRFEADYRQYYLIRERPDGSGRHTLGLSFRTGITGPETPIFENFYAGGFSTLRGFQFRGASPSVNGVRVGGEFMFLGSTEYIFPLTADDMVKGALFCDYGTVESDVAIRGENFRVAPGLGLRISIPAMGPAPLALDFAFPVAKAETDEKRIFSFFFGVGR